MKTVKLNDIVTARLANDERLEGTVIDVPTDGSIARVVWAGRPDRNGHYRAEELTVIGNTMDDLVRDMAVDPVLSIHVTTAELKLIVRALDEVSVTRVGGQLAERLGALLAHPSVSGV